MLEVCDIPSIWRSPTAGHFGAALDATDAWIMWFCPVLASVGEILGMRYAAYQAKER